jgi:hypothetical protein
MAMRVAVIMACVDVDIVDEVDVRIRRMGSPGYVIRMIYRYRVTVGIGPGRGLSSLAKNVKSLGAALSYSASHHN